MPRRNTAEVKPTGEKPTTAKPPIVPPPPKVTARAMRPLWRDLILRVWGADPLQCPCCKATMKVVDTFFRSGEIKFFLRLHGLWEGVIDIPPPPEPPFDIDTFEPIEPPWQAIREWIPDDDAEPGGTLYCDPEILFGVRFNEATRWTSFEKFPCHPGFCKYF